MTAGRTTISTLFFDFKVASGLVFVSTIVVFGLAYLCLDFNDDIYFGSLFASGLLASILFYIKRTLFGITATVIQILISAALSYSTMLIWAHPAIILYLPLILSHATGLLLVFAATLTPLSFVVSKYLTNYIFSSIRARINKPIA